MRWTHFALILFATLLTGSFTWVRLELIRLSYSIQELEARERGLRDESNALTLHIDEAKSPQRLERLAKTRFGMHLPEPSQIVVMKERL